MLATKELKKTKIVATIGPATESIAVLTKLVQKGMNVARLNMSHGSIVEHRKRIETIRMVEKKLDTRIAILMDLSGPKIRIGDFESGSVVLAKGQQFILSTKKCLGTKEKVYLNYARLPREVKKGTVIMLDDGRRKLKVIKVTGPDIITKVVVGGMIRSRRGVNLPGTVLSVASLTSKDKKDLLLGVAQKVDFFALSFVRSAKDINGLRAILKKRKCKAGIIAKIETLEAVEQIDEIIEATDALMVARGDLAIEIGPENVPSAQKNMIRKAIEKGVPTIVATQMLESMIHAPVPTRAEVSDIANSILDGADAIMLSEETALGEFPVEAVAVMAHVAHKTESDHDYFHKNFRINNGNVVDSVSLSVVHTARNVDAVAIVALSESGFTPRMIARHRSTRPVFAVSPHEEVLHKMVLLYGAIPVKIRPFHYVAEVEDNVRKYMLKNHFAKKGDRIIIAAGIPFGKVGGTNMMFVLTV